MENKTELSHDLILLALNKIDELVKSNSELSNGITQLNTVIVGLELNWKDLKEELKEARQDSRSAISAIEEMYRIVDARLDILERDKISREILETEKKNSQLEREKKLKHRLLVMQWTGSFFIGAFTVLHVPWKKMLIYITGVL